MNRYFVNFSNHSSMNWNNKQIEEAEKWGRIIDVPFPDIDPMSDEDGILNIAEISVKQIMEYDPAAVMCQGEFSLTYAVVEELRKKGVVVVSACSGRETDEQILADGTACKTSLFDFVRFRKYTTLDND